LTIGALRKSAAQFAAMAETLRFNPPSCTSLSQNLKSLDDNPKLQAGWLLQPSNGCFTRCCDFITACFKMLIVPALDVSMVNFAFDGEYDFMPLRVHKKRCQLQSVLVSRMRCSLFT